MDKPEELEKVNKGLCPECDCHLTQDSKEYKAFNKLVCTQCSFQVYYEHLK